MTAKQLANCGSLRDAIHALSDRLDVLEEKKEHALTMTLDEIREVYYSSPSFFMDAIVKRFEEKGKS